MWYPHGTWYRLICVASWWKEKAQVAPQLVSLPDCGLHRHCNAYGLIHKHTATLYVHIVNTDLCLRTSASCCWSQGWLFTRLQRQICYLALQGRNQSCPPFYFLFTIEKKFLQTLPWGQILYSVLVSSSWVFGFPSIIHKGWTADVLLVSECSCWSLS